MPPATQGLSSLIVLHGRHPCNPIVLGVLFLFYFIAGLVSLLSIGSLVFVFRSNIGEEYFDFTVTKLKFWVMTPIVAVGALVDVALDWKAFYVFVVQLKLYMFGFISFLLLVGPPILCAQFERQFGETPVPVFCYIFQGHIITGVVYWSLAGNRSWV